MFERLLAALITVPLCGRIRVHGRRWASVAIGWRCGEAIDRSPDDNDSTKHSGGAERASGPGPKMHEPHVCHCLRTDAAERRRRVVLLLRPRTDARTSARGGVCATRMAARGRCMTAQQRTADHDGVFVRYGSYFRRQQFSKVDASIREAISTHRGDMRNVTTKAYLTDLFG